jgi:G3E family GTPase
MKTLQKIPVVILNGFLGSGKTTLFRSLLSQSKKQNIPVCAIVNDMSELDVDGELLSNTTVVEHDSNILESISSCVLSSKKGIEKLDQAIQKLLMNTSPKLIIIETSGSCHPMPLVQYFKNHKLVQLTGVLVLVDSLMLVDDFNNGESLIPKMQQNMAEGKRDLVNLLVEQIMFCNHLFLTKVDKVEKDKLTYLSTFIQKINPLVSVHSLLFGNLSITSLLALEVYNYSSVAQLEKELAPILDTEQHTEKPYNLEISIIKDDRPFHPQRLECLSSIPRQTNLQEQRFFLACQPK